MSEKYEFRHLFTPFRIGSVEIRNRMVFQPHVPYYGSADGYPTETTKRYYIERAKGGTGLCFLKSSRVLIMILYGIMMILLQLILPLNYSISSFLNQRGFHIHFGAARGIGSVSYAVSSR